MSSELDEVGERLAEQWLAARLMTGNRLTAYADRRGGRLGFVAGLAGLVGAVPGIVSMFRKQSQLPDQRATRRLYEAATGIDRDQANADLAFVTDRLSPLVYAPEGPRGDALMVSAAHRLVAWVAAGRVADEQMSGVETAFARWVEVDEDDDPDAQVLMERAASYAAAWDAATSPPQDEAQVID
jgi:hypothetical protein